MSLRGQRKTQSRRFLISTTLGHAFYSKGQTPEAGPQGWQGEAFSSPREASPRPDEKSNRASIGCGKKKARRKAQTRGLQAGGEVDATVCTGNERQFGGYPHGERR